VKLANDDARLLLDPAATQGTTHSRVEHVFEPRCRVQLFGESLSLRAGQNHRREDLGCGDVVVLEVAEARGLFERPAES
jgi:hypothetical protein